jgi:selenophosphate synthetase-related protein
MSDKPKKQRGNAKDISRRGLLGTAALVVGAATSAMVGRAALAKATDVSLDAQGRVVIDGNLVREAANKNSGGATGTKKTGHNEQCTNTACAAQPASAKTTKPKAPAKNTKNNP